MWKLLNALYHVASYVLFLVVLLGASCKLLNIFLFHDFIPFTVELLLVVLSSVAQQEVENISDNVKKGLKMKMQRGELIGFQGCLGYDYHPEDKSITVNHAEAEIVRYIFNIQIFLIFKRKIPFFLFLCYNH